jgi:hypothetical protein
MTLKEIKELLESVPEINKVAYSGEGHKDECYGEFFEVGNYDDKNYAVVYASGDSVEDSPFMNYISKSPQIISDLVSKLSTAIEALEEMLDSHYNLYKSTFGEDSNPDNDLVRLKAQQAIKKIQEGYENL